MLQMAKVGKWTLKLTSHALMVALSSRCVGDGFSHMPLAHHRFSWMKAEKLAWGSWETFSPFRFVNSFINDAFIHRGIESKISTHGPFRRPLTNTLKALSTDNANARIASSLSTSSDDGCVAETGGGGGRLCAAWIYEWNDVSSGKNILAFNDSGQQQPAALFCEWKKAESGEEEEEGSLKRRLMGKSIITEKRRPLKYSFKAFSASL